MQDIKKEIEDLNAQTKTCMDKWSILDEAEKLVKDYGIDDTASIYQTKSYWASKFVNLCKKIEELQKI